MVLVPGAVEDFRSVYLFEHSLPRSWAATSVHAK